MEKSKLSLDNRNLDVYSLNTIVVGSGAAGFNAADRLYNFGQDDIAILTEGINKGTSRNTGSDKQTYYKLTLAGDETDSVYEMARTLYQGGSMDGDIALVEAALSAPSFFHLADIGVPFPHNKYGEYVGYKTDHDPRQRATSAGPLTSKYMTEKLEKQVKQKGIELFAGYQVIEILTDNNQAVGLLALNLNQLDNDDSRYVLFNVNNIIYATGGPAGMYGTSVYPVSQTGASGTAFEAGVKGKNLTESQYGIASIKFRWNLSGTYQQVLPRYVSTKKDGSDEKEFLTPYFDDPGQMLDAVFLKGYQWPFDPRKVADHGSSLIDILVYNEIVNKDRRVWLDFTANPEGASKNGELDFSVLGAESHQYLENSGALFGTPIERLAHMNEPAIELYRDHNIELTEEYLEIAVCAQHNNGGLAGNLWWESNLEHFFPVGEVNGTHGVYRPGGSALNSGQVGSTRAAQYIANRYQDDPLRVKEFYAKSQQQIREKIALGEAFLNNKAQKSTVGELRNRIGERMNQSGAHIRSFEKAETAARNALRDLEDIENLTKLSSIDQLGTAFKNYDLLIAQYVYLSAVKNYIEQGGRSRGSYLVYDKQGNLPADNIAEEFRYTLQEGDLDQKVQETIFEKETNKCQFQWRQTRDLPEEKSWFENVWNKYRKGEVVK
ncbi:MAG: FAD-binding protein [Bacillota bacterium]